jgi:hypothetical protein
MPNSRPRSRKAQRSARNICSNFSGPRTPRWLVFEKTSQLLNAVIQGRALQILVDQRNWSEDRIRAALQEALDVALLRVGLNKSICEN